MSEEKIKPYEIEEMIKPMLTTEQLEVLEREGELILHILSQDLTGCVSMCSVKEERMRWHFVSFSFEIPLPKDLGIPEAVVNLTSKKEGYGVSNRSNRKW